MVVDSFDEIVEQSRHQSLVFGIALHAFLVGQPYRLRYLRQALEHVVSHREQVWLATSGAIARSFAERVPAAL
jgi:allantoinase